MQKTIRSMLVLGAVCSGLWTNTLMAAPADNTVPPCDESANSTKPSCRNDAGSVNRPPKMPNERGVIVPPEVPAEGLPNQDQRRRDRAVPPADPRQPGTVDPGMPRPGGELRN